MAGRKGLALACLGGLVIGVIVGIFSMYMSLRDKNHVEKGLHSSGRDQNEISANIQKKLLQDINAENIRENLRELTAHPHLAGTPADYKTAEQLSKHWKKHGFKSWITPYDILLSYPDEARPNKIELQDGTGGTVFTTQLIEKILRPDQNQSNVVPPFNAFSSAGAPKGPLLYVNYGRVEDFTWLKEDKQIDFQGKICIARYGKIFRGNKANFAKTFGCSGLILYTDPADYNSGEVDSVYPDSWWMPPTGVQRGNVKMSSMSNGDPLTPGYPSIDSAYRINETDAKDLPHIPVHPISYGDAQILMQNMSGEEVPHNWRGNLPITYRIGPGFRPSGWSVQMQINNQYKRVKIHNVFAMIKGNLEPDRYVLLGNHHDAWVFGSMDPSGGTAIMMELSRVMGELTKKGWKPRRSILFCAWGAEEPGVIGSREWVEQYSSLLSSRAVAYLNIDTPVTGDFTLKPRGLPLLHNTLYKVAKTILNPDEREVSKGRKTIYDTWKFRDPEIDSHGKHTGYPRIGLLGSGSDFEPFISKIGVTCGDIIYRFDPSLGVPGYPLYHTVYETFHLVNDIMDKEFVYHRAVGQFWGELARQLVDSVILPYDVRAYTKSLTSFKDNIEKSYISLLNENGLSKSLEYLQQSIDAYSNAANDFHMRLKDVNITNELQVRMINDQMMNLERAFIDPQGLPGRPLVRNVILASNNHNSYSGSSYPGIKDALFEIEKLEGTESLKRWEEVKKQFSVVTFYIQSAAAVLQDWTSFQFS